MTSSITTAFPWKPPSVGGGLKDQRQSDLPLPNPGVARFKQIGTASVGQVLGTATEQVPSRHLPRVHTLASLASNSLTISPDSAELEVWEGVVVSVDREKNVMDVTLEAKISPIPMHTGSIGLEWVSDQDLELVRSGAVFYLTLYKQTLRGTIKNSQELRFRRRFNWSKLELDRISAGANALSGRPKDRPMAND